jgi:hypothetical protein
VAEHFPGQRVQEGLALAEDRVLLADLGTGRLGHVEEDLAALGRDDQPLDRLEGGHEVVGDEREGGGDPIRHAGGGSERKQEREEGQQRQEDAGGLQNATEG